MKIQFVVLAVKEFTIYSSVGLGSFLHSPVLVKHCHVLFHPVWVLFPFLSYLIFREEIQGILD